MRFPSDTAIPLWGQRSHRTEALGATGMSDVCMRLTRYAFLVNFVCVLCVANFRRF